MNALIAQLDAEKLNFWKTVADVLTAEFDRMERDFPTSGKAVDCERNGWMDGNECRPAIVDRRAA